MERKNQAKTQKGKKEHKNKTHLNGEQSSSVNSNVKGQYQDSEVSEREQARVIYIASTCHTCKIPADSKRGIKLSSCAGCRMLNYCSREHQLEDWKSHKPLCTQIQKILKAQQKTYLYQDCDEFVRSQAEWLQIRYSYMQLLRDQLGRELLPYEKEIFLFPLYWCIICSETKLTLCDTCHHHHHQSALSTKPENKWCEEFQVWLELVRWEAENGLVKPSCDEREASIVINNLSTDFPKDIQAYFSMQKRPRDMPEAVWKTAIADIATVPLTIVWAAMEYASQLTQSDNLTIHLIGAEMDFEGCCPNKWEFCFMHLLQSLSNLQIVLIGPELVTESSVSSLCQACRDKGRQLTIIHKPGVLYHDYEQEEGYLRPNIICAFNCGIYRKTGFNGEDTWAPTIPLLGKTDILISTAYTETEVSQDIRRILSECKGLKLSGQFRQNPYRSLRPQRTLINEDVEPLMYKNQYIAVFQVPQ